MMKIMELTKLKPCDAEIASAMLHADESGDFLWSVLNSPEVVYSVTIGQDIVAFAHVEGSYVSVFVPQEKRCHGFGSDSLKLAEDIIKSNGKAQCITSYSCEDDTSVRFAIKHGYKRDFSSAYMVYNGKGFDTQSLPVREYKDEDFYEAHGLYARAFHEMRIRTGDFPNSKVEQSAEKIREAWAKDTKSRLVYCENNEVVAVAHIVCNEIGSVAVKSELQGKGIGRRFVKHICNTILNSGYNSVTLYCVKGNFARELYDSLGFKEKLLLDYASKKLTTEDKTNA